MSPMNVDGSSRFYAYNIVFMLARFATIIISVLTLWYGLRAIETPYIDFEKGNFNTSTIRWVLGWGAGVGHQH